MKYEIIKATMDRPLGSVHPDYPDMIYPINYGFVEGVFAPDGEEQDVYVLGVSTPVLSFEGKKIAVVHRHDDVEEKWVVCPVELDFTKEEIVRQINFQEKYFDSFIEML